MIRKNNERTIDTKTNFKDGPGAAIFKSIATSEELFNKIKMYSEITFKKDCGIGYHSHNNEEEIMVVIKGQGLYNDDGNESLINEGDVVICLDGHSHSITNNNDEELKVIAMVLYK